MKIIKAIIDEGGTIHSVPNDDIGKPQEKQAHVAGAALHNHARTDRPTMHAAGIERGAWAFTKAIDHGAVRSVCLCRERARESLVRISGPEQGRAKMNGREEGGGRALRLQLRPQVAGMSKERFTEPTEVPAMNAT